MTLKIPIAKPIITDEEIQAVINVLKSGILTRGPETRRFEQEYAEYIGTKYAVTVMNGTIALEASLKAMGIGPGDEVIVPDFSFIATANAVLNVGAKPVFADITEDTMTLDPDSFNEKITGKTKAVIPVHLFGHPADMNAINEIAIDHNIMVLEDAAQSHGAMINGVKTGSLGHAGAFSLYATKNMMTGEGGVITTSIEAIHERLLKLRKHGETKRYVSETLGSNLHMTEMQAAIGRIQLRKLDSLNNKRRKNAEKYNKELSKIKEITIPQEKQGYYHVYHQYVIKVPVEDRDKLYEHLRQQGIGVAIHYPIPLHEHPIYKALGYPENQNPTARELSKKVLSLPVHPLLTNQEIEYVINKVKEYYNQ